MVETVPTRLTADEFYALSFPNERVELVRGEVIRMAPPGGEHGVIAGRIFAFLFNHVAANRLGVVCAAETGFLITRDPDTVRGPDASFVSNERKGSAPAPRTYWPFAPDLAVEVVSPGDTAEEIEAKVQEWLAGGARMVWVLYPVPGTVHVFRSPGDARILRGDDSLNGEDVVPGFACRVGEVFEQ